MTVRKRDHAVGDEQRELRLRDAAAARQREVPEQQDSRSTSEPTVGTSSRRHAAPPAGYMRAASRPVSRMKATTDQADQRADDEAQDQRELMLVLA